MSRGAFAPRPDRTALLFPTGGYLWPGMGADIAAPPLRKIFDRFESALAPFDVAPGSLHRLMAGAGQARRDRNESGWSWTGDFPLSMVAQTALGVALARAFVETWGPPGALAGESMGELAAYCAAGVLTPEHTSVLTYRWSRDLQAASDILGLRMAVVEDVPESDLAGFAESIPARVVVADAPTLYVLSLPRTRLDILDAEVIRRGGRILVSNNPCAAHDPRLAEALGIWDAHEAFLAGIPFRPPEIPLWSTLDPGKLLADPESLRANRRDTAFHRVRWADTIRRMAASGVAQLVQFGPSSSGYPLKKLRSQDAGLAHLRIAVVATMGNLRGKAGGRG